MTHCDGRERCSTTKPDLTTTRLCRSRQWLRTLFTTSTPAPGNLPTRRLVLSPFKGAAFAGTAVTIAATAAAAESPDAELLMLDAQLKDAWLLENQAYATAEATGDADRTAAAAMEVTDRIARRILGTSAKTLTGLLVKLRAFLWCHGDEPFKLADIDDDPEPAFDIRLLGSIITDLSAMGSAPV